MYVASSPKYNNKRIVRSFACWFARLFVRCITFYSHFYSILGGHIISLTFLVSCNFGSCFWEFHYQSFAIFSFTKTSKKYFNSLYIFSSCSRSYFSSFYIFPFFKFVKKMCVAQTFSYACLQSQEHLFLFALFERLIFFKSL